MNWLVRLRWMFVALGAAAVAAVVFALQPRPVAPDPRVFIVIGRGITRGQIPFIDLWDFKPPGVYAFGAIAWLLDPGDSGVSTQVLSVAAIALTATACGWLVSAVCSRFWAGVATAGAVAGALSYPTLNYGGGMTELYAIAGLSICVAAVAAVYLGRSGLRWPVLAGLGFAWAMNCSVLTVAAAPSLAVMWLSSPIDGQPYPLAIVKWRAWIGLRILDRRLAAAVVAAGLTTMVFWLPVIAGGAVPAAIDALWRYNALYSATGSYEVRSAASGIWYLWPLWLPALLFALVPTGRRLPLGLAVLRSNLGRAAVLWTIVQFVLVVIGRRYYAHNMTLLVPPLGILTGLVIGGLWSDRAELARFTRGRQIGSVALSLIVALGLVVQFTPAASSTAFISANDRLADYVRANSSPADTIWVWGADPEIYLRADRNPAGPYFQIYPLMMPGYDQKAMDTLLPRWQAHPPLLIVTSRLTSDSDLLGLYPFAASSDMQEPLKTYYEYVAPFQAFVQAHYDLVATFDIGEVWRYHG